MVETLMALAITALMLGAVMSAQALVLRSETRARALPALRSAVNRLLMLNMLGVAPDADASPTGLSWRMGDVLLDDGQALRHWTIFAPASPETRMAVWLR